MTTDVTDRITRLERTNRRLTLALVAIAAAGTGALLTAATSQPGTEYAALAIDPETRFLYRMNTRGTLDRVDLKAGREAPPEGAPEGSVATPGRWNPFYTGR